MNRLVLIGPRGSGKTSVAAVVAARLGWDWVDADAELQRRAGRTVRELFATEGEAGFRDREAAILAELCRLDRVVIATGGGAVLRDANRALLRESGVVVWLTADPETLYRRITADDTSADTRPNLGPGGLEEVRQVLAAREPLYRQCAHHAIETAGQSPGAVAEAVISAWRSPAAR